MQQGAVTQDEPHQSPSVLFEHREQHKRQRRGFHRPALTKEMLVTMITESFIVMTSVTPTPQQAHQILVSTVETSLNTDL